jgi:hypothetical protein
MLMLCVYVSYLISFWPIVSNFDPGYNEHGLGFEWISQSWEISCYILVSSLQKFRILGFTVVDLACSFYVDVGIESSDGRIVQRKCHTYEFGERKSKCQTSEFIDLGNDFHSNKMIINLGN